MGTPSCSEVVGLALFSVAVVSTFHTAARPLIPNVRPLNCAFCMALWVSMALAARLWSVEALAAIPVAGFFAVVAAGMWPWAFYWVPVPPPRLASPEQTGTL